MNATESKTSWSIRNHLSYEVGTVETSGGVDPVAAYACKVNASYTTLSEARYTARETTGQTLGKKPQ